MRITSSLVFFLLERQCALYRLQGENAEMILAEPRILEGPEPEPGMLYITDRPELLGAIRKQVSCVFLLCGAAGREAAAQQRRLTEPWAGQAEIVCLGEEISPLDLLKRLFSLFLSLQEWDNRLKDASFEAAGDYSRVFRIAREFFDLPFVLLDRNCFAIAWTQDYPISREEETRDVPLNIPGEIPGNGTEGCPVPDITEPYLSPQGSVPAHFFCCNIFRGNHFEGRIAAIFDQSKKHPGRTRLLAHLCNYVGFVFINATDYMLAIRQSDPLHQIVRDSIFSAEGVQEQKAAAVLGELAWETGDPYHLVVFQVANEHGLAHRSSYICRHLETDVQHSCAITYASHIIWLINAKDIAQKNIRRDYQPIIASIAREFSCKAGVSKSFDYFPDLRNAYVQATAALRLGYRKDPGPLVYRFSDYVLDYIIERTTSELPVKDLLHPGAVTLWNLDRKENTDYINTLQCYMDFQYNMTQAAEKLRLHRTTLIRRLERICEITGLDFRKPREVLHLAFSLQMLSPPDLPA